jgi:putative transposase
MPYHLVLKVHNGNSCITTDIGSHLKLIVKDYCFARKTDLVSFSYKEGYIHILFNSNPSIQHSIFVNSIKTVTSRLVRKKFFHQLSEFDLDNKFWGRAYCLVADNKDAPEHIEKYLNQNTFRKGQ